MKLLFDENLSHWLAPNLADVYPDSIHVRDIGLKSEPDRDIWQYAIKNGFAIVTKDSDFNERSIVAVSSPKVIWIRATAVAITARASQRKTCITTQSRTSTAPTHSFSAA